MVAFGALVAAGIPLLLALTAVFATFGLVALPSHVLPMAMQAPAIVLLIGLAVGVDYSMFYLRREREERAAGRSEQAALEAAAATSGRSVLISGLTVMAAMAGMFLTGDATFASFGVATIIVVAIAMLGSLTVLPALLSKLGDRVDRARVPFVGRLRRDDGEGRIWGAIVDRVLRRPVLSAVLAGGLLVALALPALQLRMVTPGPDTFPQSLPDREDLRPHAAGVPRHGAPGQRRRQGAERRTPRPCARRSTGSSSGRSRAAGCTSRSRSTSTADATVANITDPDRRHGNRRRVDRGARDAPRARSCPQTVGALPNTEAGVTGLTAQWKDATDELKSKLPPVVAFVLVFAFALMLVAFRSIVVAAKAIVLNLLSVAAAYGVLVIVFQHGFAQGPARLRLDRRHRPGRAAAAVRDPVRALDGLPRPRPGPDPGDVRPRRDAWTRRSRTGSSPPPASSRARRS